jgi:hypothetical protein
MWTKSTSFLTVESAGTFFVKVDVNFVYDRRYGPEVSVGGSIPIRSWLASF